MHPAEAVEQNELLFSRDTCVVPGNIMLDRDPSSPMGRGYLGVGTPVLNDAAHCQITMAVVIISAIISLGD